ncbi:unnamed protein product [Linum tenue]|uniref:Pentatricopeptide repeat-containing protein n=1 Tax=Linum tenue TaxID=586396 RepID=A0AAV0MY51_9ROSI|nr:unnamed protein product [Linum tenue]
MSSVAGFLLRRQRTVICTAFIATFPAGRFRQYPPAFDCLSALPSKENMLSIKQATESKRILLSPLFLLNASRISSCAASSSSSSPAENRTSQHHPRFPNFCSVSYHSTAALPVQEGLSSFTINAKDVAFSFTEWFKSGKDAFLDRVFEILKVQGKEDELAVAFAQLGLRLSEALVLKVLDYGKSKYDVLTCIKFFDWAGHQHGFYHTRATYHALFKILSKSRNMSTMFDFLGVYSRDRLFLKQTAFQSILVMGYAVAGKPQIALQLFGRMRFQGLDLDAFTYHILLNSLVEEGSFDSVNAIAEQISAQGYERDVTHTIVVKSLCKQNMLDNAEAYLRQKLLEDDGHALSVLVDALCRNTRFDKAGELLEEFKELGVRPMEPAYGIWLRDLVEAGNVDGALEFLRNKKSLEGYVPEIFRYNYLLDRLLKENRLGEAYDLLTEMMEDGISPDRFTLSAALCFFCKAGMVGVALELYNSRSDLPFSPNSMVYNYLINSLCGDGKVDDAYHVLRNWTQNGSTPGRQTFYTLADTLYREGKLDKMKKLVVMALERNFTTSICEKFISAMCRAEKVEEGYLIHGELNRMNKVIKGSTYSKLISGFSKSNRGDIAARLLIEMQEKGLKPSKNVFRNVICCLCNLENAEQQVLKLLEMQASLHELSCDIYNLFIDGAGHAQRPELAKKLYEMMLRNGIQPNLASEVLLLRSYLKNARIHDAVSFFDAIGRRRSVGRVLYCTMVVNLANLDKVNLAYSYFKEMRTANELRPFGIIPSIECYEVLVQQLCDSAKYDLAVKLVYDYERVGRRVTSFMGNVLLFHSLKGTGLHQAWDSFRLTEVKDGEISEMSSNEKLSLFCQLVGAFSGCVKVGEEIEDLEELIAQCFPLNIYTYNLLLRRLCMIDMERACQFLEKILQKGYEPNRWTYDIVVHGFLKIGDTDKARVWLVEMLEKGFDLTESTCQLMSSEAGMNSRNFIIGASLLGANRSFPSSNCRGEELHRFPSAEEKNCSITLSETARSERKTDVGAVYDSSHGGKGTQARDASRLVMLRTYSGSHTAPNGTSEPD